MIARQVKVDHLYLATGTEFHYDTKFTDDAGCCQCCGVNVCIVLSIDNLIVKYAWVLPSGGVENGPAQIETQHMSEFLQLFYMEVKPWTMLWWTHAISKNIYVLWDGSLPDLFDFVQI